MVDCGTITVGDTSDGTDDGTDDGTSDPGGATDFDPFRVDVSCNFTSTGPYAPGDSIEVTATVTNNNPETTAGGEVVLLIGGSRADSRAFQVPGGGETQTVNLSGMLPSQEGSFQIETELQNVQAA